MIRTVPRERSALRPAILALLSALVATRAGAAPANDLYLRGCDPEHHASLEERTNANAPAGVAVFRLRDNRAAPGPDAHFLTLRDERCATLEPKLVEALLHVPANLDGIQLVPSAIVEGHLRVHDTTVQGWRPYRIDLYDVPTTPTSTTRCLAIRSPEDAPPDPLVESMATTCHWTRHPLGQAQAPTQLLRPAQAALALLLLATLLALAIKGSDRYLR